MLNENIIALSKRRSQLKTAVTKMVQKCCTYVEFMPTKELKLKLIDTLRTVSAGKVVDRILIFTLLSLFITILGPFQIYVEVERARLTHILAQMKEADGEIAEAANVLQELQVETYGSMERREKVCLNDLNLLF